MKRIIIIQEGQWGSLKHEDYQDFVDYLVNILSNIKREFDGCFSKKGEKEAVVEVVATSAEAEAQIRQQAANARIDIVIFVSRDMSTTAERFAKMFPKTKIMVFTGLIPDGQVVWVDKKWLMSPEILKNIVLSG